MHVCRLGCKKAQISNTSLEMKNMDLELSKTVPGISLRPLERFLEIREKVEGGGLKILQINFQLFFFLRNEPAYRQQNVG